MVEGVTLPILLPWSSIREMRGDTTTIVLPPATDVPDILIQNKRKTLVAYYSLVPGRAWERG